MANTKATETTEDVKKEKTREDEMIDYFASVIEAGGFFVEKAMVYDKEGGLYLGIITPIGFSGHGSVWHQDHEIEHRADKIRLLIKNPNVSGKDLGQKVA